MYSAASEDSHLNLALQDTQGLNFKLGTEYLSILNCPRVCCRKHNSRFRTYEFILNSVRLTSFLFIRSCDAISQSNLGYKHITVNPTFD